MGQSSFMNRARSSGASSRTAAGRGAYFSHNGDRGVLRQVTGGAFELTETDGVVTRFHGDGRLDLVRDPNGKDPAGTMVAAWHSGNLAAAQIFKKLYPRP